MSENKKDKAKEWLIKLVQDRYGWLSLTHDQAESIHRYETDIEKVHSDNYIPSFWEEKEIEFYFFKQVLTEEQMVVYQNTISEQIEDGRSHFANEDKEALRDVACCEKLLAFYRNQLAPKLIQHKKENYIGKLPKIKRRIDFLKDGYNEFLRVRFKEICVAHFRYSRNFQPNKFRAELLRHEIEKTLPSYYFFEKSSDQTVVEMSRFLFEKMKYEFGIYNEFLGSISDWIETTTDEIYSEFYERIENGFGVIELGSDRSETKKREDEFLSYLLIDNEKYDWQ
jgi:hypothetical protein